MSRGNFGVGFGRERALQVDSNLAFLHLPSRHPAWRLDVGESGNRPRLIEREPYGLALPSGVPAGSVQAVNGT